MCALYTQTNQLQGFTLGMSVFVKLTLVLQLLEGCEPATFYLSELARFYSRALGKVSIN